MADEPEPDPSESGTDNTNDTDTGDTEALGDAGRRALDSERRARREAEAQLRELRPLADRARELEDADKTEQQRLTEQLSTATAEGTRSATEALRLDVALEHAPEGTPPARIRKLARRLQGDSREDLEADAAELFAEFTAPPSDDRRPREDLRRVPMGADKPASSAGMNDWMRNQSR